MELVYAFMGSSNSLIKYSAKISLRSKSSLCLFERKEKAVSDWSLERGQKVQSTKHRDLPHRRVRQQEQTTEEERCSAWLKRSSYRSFRLCLPVTGSGVLKDGNANASSKLEIFRRFETETRNFKSSKEIPLKSLQLISLNTTGSREGRGKDACLHTKYQHAPFNVNQQPLLHLALLRLS